MERCGFKVVACTADGASLNRASLRCMETNRPTKSTTHTLS